MLDNIFRPISTTVFIPTIMIPVIIIPTILTIITPVLLDFRPP
jgi:hypothetical protein